MNQSPNYICNNLYVCSGVLKKIINYLDEQSKINLKFTCRYLRDKVLIEHLHFTNHRSAILYPELKFVKLRHPPLRDLYLPKSGSVYIADETILDYYDYNSDDIKNLCMETLPGDVNFDEEDYIILPDLNLKELYILKNTDHVWANELFNKNQKDSLEKLYIRSYFYDDYFTSLKILRCLDYHKHGGTNEIFIITGKFYISNVNLKNLVLVNFYITGNHIEYRDDINIENFYICDFHCIDIQLPTKKSTFKATKIFIINCSTEVINILKQHISGEYIITDKSVLPQIYNDFGIDFYD